MTIHNATKKISFKNAPTLIKITQRVKNKNYPKEIYVFGLMSQDPDINELEAHRTLKKAFIDYGVEEINRIGNDYAVYTFKKLIRLVKRGQKVTAVDIKPSKQRSTKK